MLANQRLWATIMLLSIALSLAWVVAGCSSKMSTKKEQKLFAGAPYQPQHRKLVVSGHHVHYVWAGDTTLQPLLFVHGSPGSWEDYVDYLKDSVLLTRYYIAAVDRPGFGQSDYGKPMVELEDQSKLISAVLADMSPTRPVVLVGHSYGGPLVVRVAMDDAAHVRAMVLLAAAVDPSLEEKEWFRPVARNMSWVLPEMLMASNEELAHLKQDLEEMLPLWPTLRLPIVDVHGTKDMLVPFGNLAFAQRQAINAKPFMPIILPKVNHFIPWSHHDTVRTVLMDLATK